MDIALCINQRLDALKYKKGYLLLYGIIYFVSARFPLLCGYF